MGFDSFSAHPMSATWQIDQYEVLKVIRVIVSDCTSAASQQVGDRGYNNSNKNIVS